MAAETMGIEAAIGAAVEAVARGIAEITPRRPEILIREQPEQNFQWLLGAAMGVGAAEVEGAAVVKDQLKIQVGKGQMENRLEPRARFVT